jgi:hypothetical protein
MRVLLATFLIATLSGTGLGADTGTITRLRCNQLQVGQVGLITYDGTNPVHAKAIQVIDDNTAIMEWSSTLHWVEMPTSGMVDGKSYVMDRVMRITGTKRYTTVLGAQRTVLAMEAVDEADMDALPRQPEPEASPELEHMIAKLEFELEDLEAVMAKHPNAPRQIENPKRLAARQKSKSLREALSQLKRFKQIGTDKATAALQQAGRKAANEWAITQTRGGVKRLLGKPALRNRAIKAAGPYLTQDMQEAFIEGYLQECERYATAESPVRPK